MVNLPKSSLKEGLAKHSPRIQIKSYDNKANQQSRATN